MPSISGDGGFLFSGMEFETAVRLKSNLVHMIWIDGSYDMVAVQERQKYGRTSGIKFGPLDPVRYAEAFGARGMMIRAADEIVPILKQALRNTGPVLIGVHVDYPDNRASSGKPQTSGPQSSDFQARLVQSRAGGIEPVFYEQVTAVNDA